MERTPRGIYSAEFRAETVKLVETTGVSVARAAKQLSIPKSSLNNWVRASLEGKLADVGKGQRPPSELEIELARTRKKLGDLKMERDLLKSFRRFSLWSRGEIRSDRRIATVIPDCGHVTGIGRIREWLPCLAQSPAIEACAGKRSS